MTRAATRAATSAATNRSGVRAVASGTAARVAVIAVVLAVVALALTRVLGGEEEPRRLTATFPSTISLYEGAQVKVLGVQVGEVTAITVVDSAVQVEIEYDADVDLPVDVHAVVVPPSVVGDRFVQLAPVYGGGEVLADGARIGLDRTSVPLELDDTYRALDDLAQTLGPDGANKDGALSRLVRSAARNLEGRGRLFNQTLRDVADAIATVAQGSDDFGATTRNLATVTRTLKGKDRVIRSLVTNLVTITTDLNSQEAGLRAAATDLDGALSSVRDLLRENRTSLTEDLKGVRRLSRQLNDHSAELIEVTELGPVGLVNLLHTYVPSNWDPLRPQDFGPDGRTGSQALHAAMLNDLDIQLTYAFSSACASFTPDQRAQLSAFCDAVQATGGSLSSLLDLIASAPAGGR